MKLASATEISFGPTTFFEHGAVSGKRSTYQLELSGHTEREVVYNINGSCLLPSYASLGALISLRVEDQDILQVGGKVISGKR